MANSSAHEDTSLSRNMGSTSLPTSLGGDGMTEDTRKPEMLDEIVIPRFHSICEQYNINHHLAMVVLFSMAIMVGNATLWALFSALRLLGMKITRLLGCVLFKLVRMGCQRLERTWKLKYFNGSIKDDVIPF